MRARWQRVSSTMTVTAGIVAALLVVGLPIVYFTIAYEYARGALDTQAEVNARQAGQLVVANPELWAYEQVRLGELLEARSAAGVPEVRRILDPSGQVVAESADPLAPPTLSRRHPIFDAGVRVAEVEVARSLRPILLETGVALLVALLVAALVFTALRVIPLRAVRHAYASLEESERRYRSLYDSMGEGMALLRVGRGAAGGGVSARVVDANPACARMLGLEVPALVGEDADALLGGVLVPFLPALLEVERTHQPFAFEISVARGSRALRLSAFSPHAGHVAAVIEDLTERRRAAVAQRQLQEHLAQAQKMELVGRLAGGVAHDFNNILTVILSYARALTDELRGEQREFAQEIGSAGQRASALTRQLLAFSRKQVLCPEVLAVGEVVKSLVKMLGRLIGEDIELSLAVAPGVGSILMDPAQLEQVLVNLAVNARDAMPDGGRLAIEVRDADVSAVDARRPGGIPEGSYVTITVTDTGTGMDADTLQHLYEPFFTTKPQGKGTGLGLSMVLGAVEQSGGTLRVVSAPGAGTTFTLHLPRVPAAEAPAAFGTSGAPESAGGRILVVEDEPQVRGAVRLFLVSAGYEVVEAACGDDGLAAFRADPEGIDLVLTDLVMPGMSGSALGRAVRTLRPVPVLYMSGYSEEIASGREAVPPQSLLLKPFEREALLARVHAALHAASASASGIPAPAPRAPAGARASQPRN